MYTGSGAPALGLDAQQSIHAEVFVAGLTLLVGDTVFFDPATSRVNKTLTAADYDSLVGVVVGGRSTYGQILQNDADIGKQAALVGEEVLVAWGGIVKCLSDAAIVAGDRVTAATATTAGRIKTAVAAAGNFPLGTALNAAGGAAIVMRVLLSISKVAIA